MDAQPQISPTPHPPARVFSLDRYRQGGVPSADVPLNAEWDRLARLAEEAWTWRDPEALAALGLCVARLGLRTLDDWR
jgi:hypothetical protein